MREWVILDQFPMVKNLPISLLPSYPQELEPSPYVVNHVPPSHADTLS